MRKRVLIGYADNGSGHKSASQYIKNYFEDKKKYDVMVINLSDYINVNYKLGSVIFNHASKNDFLFRLFFEISNSKITSKKYEKLCIKAYDSQELRKVIRDFNPDFIVSTHYFFSYLASFYNKTNVVNSYIMTVISDFSYHKAWISNSEDVDFFVVKNEMEKNVLVSYYVPSEKIFAFGSPVNVSSNLDIDDRDFSLKKYSLSGKKPIYLFFGGGTKGYDYVFDYFKSLIKRHLPLDIIFVAGKNKSLKIKCENYILKNDIKNVIVLGFSKDIYNLYSISDIVITKPGSSTLGECIDMKKPCILIPGVEIQEKYNAKFMVKNHYASKVNSPSGLAKKVKLFLNYPFIVNSMRNRLNKINSDNSCKKIYEFVDKILKEK